MTTALQDEYHAYWAYRGVVADFGDIQPFVNIIRAEQRHASSVAAAFERRTLAVPPSAWTLDNVPRFASTGAACAAAVEAEVANIALYDRYLLMDLPADVRQVFENNRTASLESHLPAFERCR